MAFLSWALNWSETPPCAQKNKQLLQKNIGCADYITTSEKFKSVIVVAVLATKTAARGSNDYYAAASIFGHRRN